MNTVDDLLESVKIRSLAPISQDTFTNTKILKLMTEEMRTYVVPLLIDVREDFFLNYVDVSFEANRSLYPIYERSAGNSFKALYAVSSSGDESKIGRTSVDKLSDFTQSGDPTHFFLMGDQIKVLPTPKSNTNSLRQYYFRTQSSLTQSINCGRITSVAVGALTTVFTISTDLSAALGVGDKVDFQNSQSPFLLWAHDVEIQGITSTTITVNNSDILDESGNVRMGIDDYICPRFQTNIPQIPVEYHTLLVQKTVCKIIGSLGDQRKFQIEMAELKMMEGSLFKLIKSRVEAQPQKVTNRGIWETLG